MSDKPFTSFDEQRLSEETDAKGKRHESAKHPGWGKC
jgi:hypothetical protein